MLAAIVEFERELIRERKSEGRKRAKANGVRFGRKPKLSVSGWGPIRSPDAECANDRHKSAHLLTRAAQQTTRMS
jgi:DNA invertase Pin-like site-specific DNA recombinase